MNMLDIFIMVKYDNCLFNFGGITEISREIEIALNINENSDYENFSFFYVFSVYYYNFV